MCSAVLHTQAGVYNTILCRAEELAHGAVYSLCTIIILPVVVDSLSALLKGFYHYKTFMSIKSDHP